MKWIKSNGQEIETNELDATIKVCLEMGWKQADKVKQVEEAPKRRGRPPRESE